LRELLNQKKIGHGGTLDPIATGVLPVCLGNSCRLFSYLLNGDKRYLITITLGFSTDTFDSFGKVKDKGTYHFIEEKEVVDVLGKFTGDILQKPPIFSAIKYKGTPLYKFARSGEKIEIKPRKVLVKSIKVIKFDPPIIILDVVVGRGFYARSLANDLGSHLRVPSHMSSLKRLMTGSFSIQSSYSVQQIEEIFTIGEMDSILLPIDYIVKDLPIIYLSKEQSHNIINGQSIQSSSVSFDFLEEDFRTFRIYNHQDVFIALGNAIDSGTLLKPIKVFK
tara:strand:- start:86 stop:919 length:834 start_codon:yes stop_codon:yes gene_type:complete